MDPRVKTIISNPVPYIFIGAVLAFINPGPSHDLSEYIFTCMIVIMYLSTTDIKFRVLLEFKRYLSKVAVGILLNYGLVSFVTLALAFVFFSEGDIFAGFVIIAAMPTAVAVIPLTYLAKGNCEVALVGVTLTYVMALILAPTIVFVFLGGSVDIWQIFEALLLVIVFPMLASRVLVYLEIDKKIGIAKNVMINLNFLMLMYIVIGVNNRAFFIEPGLLLMVGVVCFIRTSGTGFATLGLTKLFGVNRNDAFTYTMMASFKNLGLTAAIALVLFGERAAIPATIGMPIELFNYVILMMVFGFVHPTDKVRRKGKGRTKTAK